MWLNLMRKMLGLSRNPTGARRKCKQPARRHSLRLRVEVLEDRTVPSTLSYSTYLGGSSLDRALAVAVDSAGDTYVAGNTYSTNFPTANAFQASYGGDSDAFVAKFSATGSLVYSTYLGGSSVDVADAITVDVSGNAYVTGHTESSNFPTTAGAFQRTTSGESAFVTKLSSAGTLLYSTFLNGSGIGTGNAIAVDAAGDAYVAGLTMGGFPTTANAFEPVDPGYGSQVAYVTELNSTGTGLVYSTYLAGSVYGSFTSPDAIALDSAGKIYVAGETTATTEPTIPGADFPTTAGAFQTTNGTPNGVPFVSKLDPNVAGTPGLIYSTFLDGSSGAGDIAYGIAVNASGNAYVTGITQAANFPTTSGAFQTTAGGGEDAFVTELNTTGTGLVYSTFLAGNNSDMGAGIALDGTGNAYVTGSTSSTNFPITSNALQATYPNGSGGAAFVTELNSTGSAKIYSTFLGGNGSAYGTGISLDNSGSIYVAGATSGANFPTVNAYQPVYGGGGSTDAFVTKISQGPDFAVGFPATITAGTASTLIITAQNADGTTNTGYTGTVHFTSSDTQAVLPADYTFTAADQGVYTFCATLKTASYQSLTATDTFNSGMTGGQVRGILVNAAAATHFAISGPASVAASTAFNITVTALDAYGNVATGYTGTVHFTDSVTGATLPANYTFLASDGGVYTFTKLKLKTKGQQTITVVDTLVPSDTGTLAINVT